MTRDDLNPDPAEITPTEPKVKLRKEALTFEQPRNAVGLLAAACTLVGVIVGFSMGLLATRTGSNCHAHHVNNATPVVAQSAAVANASPGFLGVQIRSDVDEVAGDFADSAAVVVRGARVVQVIPNTPAARVGIRSGDLIVGVDAEMVTNMHALMSKIRARAPSQPVTVSFYRNGKKMSVVAPLVRLPDRLR